MLGMSCQGCIFSLEHLADEYLRGFGLGAKSGDVKEHSVCHGVNIRSFAAMLVRCWKSMEKKIPNSVGARMQPCFTTLMNGKASDVAPLNRTVPCMLSWKEETTAKSLEGSQSSRGV